MKVVSRGHSRPLTELQFVPLDEEKNSILVSACHDKLPQIRNGQTLNWIGSFIGHKGAVWSAKVDRQTHSLALTGGGDFTARLWSVNDGKELLSIDHKHIVRNVDFSEDTSTFCTGSQNGEIRIYDTASPTVPLYSSTTTSSSITKVLFSSSNTELIISRKNGSLEKIDTRVGDGESAIVSQINLLDVLNKKTNAGVVDIEHHPEQNLLLAACANYVHTLNLNDLSIIKAYEMPEKMNFNEEGGVTLGLDGTKFYAGGSDLLIREFSIENGSVSKEFNGHHGPVRCLRIHPNGKFIASGSEDATIRLWEI